MAHPQVQTKSRSVLGATELTLLAPLKRGLIPALDARSYRSRARLVLDTLHALGVSRREVDPTPGIAEVAESIRAIRSFRMAIVGEGPPQVLLSVSFDGGWEPYMRRIWRPLGPLLDLVFCNCEGYLLSTQHGFRDYIGWVRQAQVETGFYYEDSPLTVADLAVAQQALGPPRPAPAPAAGMEEQSRAALVALYRLSDMFPDRGGDGLVLLRAARLLLRELAKLTGKSPPPLPPSGLLRTPTEEAAWRWFHQQVALPFDPPPAGRADVANVQAGILEPYPGITLGRMVLVGLDDAAAVVALLDHFKGGHAITPAAPPFKLDGPLFVNLAFTHAGLALAGVDRGTLDQLPQEFREGMEARASILGDRERNHPRHWALPEAHHGSGRVQLSAVHAVVQFWLTDSDPKPLDAALSALEQTLADNGGEVLAVERMRRILNGQGAVAGHFGFADGLSQPRFAANPQGAELPLGEVLLGHCNQRGDAALEGRLWTDSSFLVVRKLRQDVAAFQALNLTPVQQGKLMGRNPNGSALIAGATGNDFNFDGDPTGRQCPLFAHIRRANPRTTRPDELDQLPRLARRGMSYGPPFNAQQPDDERGLVFLAYNASIAEQFEVVQGWLAGGNSSGEGSYSALRDPFLGVPAAGDPRQYDLGNGQSVTLPDAPLVTLQWGLYAFAPSFTALKELRRWAAERAAEDCIRDVDEPGSGQDADAVQRRRDRRDREQAALAAKGAVLIGRLMQVEQARGFDAAVDEWKLALEDLGSRMSGASQAIWAAVRRAHQGALRTPYGVLACSKTLVKQVFDNTNGDYTVTGYNTRLAQSFGEIYLGRDDGPEYRAEADPANRAIMRVTRDEAFSMTQGAAHRSLTGWIAGLSPGEDITIDVKDLVDEVLADLCIEWFGFPEGQLVKRGGWHGRPEATCPGHFHSPSRYTFQPNPGAGARDVGQQHGQLLRRQVLAFVQQNRRNRAAQGSLGQHLFTAFPDNDERLASTLIGVMMGFLPTVDGNLRGVLYEWVSDRSLWDHQAAWRRHGGPVDLARAQAVIGQPLEKTMHLRPVPELVWRTALRDSQLGPVQVRTGDTVVVGIVSAMQEELLSERRCLSLVFGGERTAPHNRPTHACPGYEMAMGVMLGLLAALLNSVSLKPTASPMALRIGAS